MHCKLPLSMSGYGVGGGEKKNLYLEYFLLEN